MLAATGQRNRVGSKDSCVAKTEAALEYWRPFDDEYYRHLQNVRDQNSWSEYIEFLLSAVEAISIDTLELVESIRNLIDTTIDHAKRNLPSATYSKELIELLFIQPYSKIEFLVQHGIAETTSF